MVRMGVQPSVWGIKVPNNLTVELPDLTMRGTALPANPRDIVSTLPLRGITVLAVEDSRFASEALRLMCQRLGARLRRAETIHAARSHLRLYRPNVVIIDLGLPDGRGEALIAEIAAGARPPVILATSGDPSGQSAALLAGAVGYLDKPLESLAAFQSLLVQHLPDRVAGLSDVFEPLHPDNLALRDDLAHAVALMEAGADPETQVYLTGFLSGVARHAHDPDLAQAATNNRPEELRALLHRRLQGADAAFGTVQPTQ